MFLNLFSDASYILSLGVFFRVIDHISGLSPIQEKYSVRS